MRAAVDNLVRGGQLLGWGVHASSQRNRGDLVFLAAMFVVEHSGHRLIFFVPALWSMLANVDAPIRLTSSQNTRRSPTATWREFATLLS